MRRFFIILVPALWIVLFIGSQQFATDFYPLHFAARLVLVGQSPYGLDATAQLAQQWQAPFANAGIAYPLPFVLLITPLALLPFSVAAVLWTAAGTTLAALSIQLFGAWRKLILLPLLFLPFQRAVVMGQATLLWFGLSVLLILAIRERWRWTAGICIGLLVLKPQTGLIFAVAGCVWFWKQDRRVLLIAASTTLLLSAVSLLIQPGWPRAWTEQVSIYNSIVHPPTILPWGLLLVAACWRLDWWARVAAIQFILFPLSDLYSALPLLVIWAIIGGPVAFVGAGVSWLWQMLQLPNTIEVMWIVVLMPLITVSASRSYGAWLIRCITSARARVSPNEELHQTLVEPDRAGATAN